MTVEQPWEEAHRPHADAMVTDRPRILLGVLTADCAPVLFADEEAGVVAAAHSGWRGAFGGVNEATIEAMERLGARRERIAAAVGPSVEQKSYEVDEAFRERFIDQDRSNGRFFIAGPAGKPHFDLTGYILQRLSDAGIGKAEALRLDTYSELRPFLQLSAVHTPERAVVRPADQYDRTADQKLSLSAASAELIGLLAAHALRRADSGDPICLPKTKSAARLIGAPSLQRPASATIS